MNAPTLIAEYWEEVEGVMQLALGPTEAHGMLKLDGHPCGEIPLNSFRTAYNAMRAMQPRIDRDLELIAALCEGYEAALKSATPRVNNAVNTVNTVNTANTVETIGVNKWRVNTDYDDEGAFLTRSDVMAIVSHAMATRAANRPPPKEKPARRYRAKTEKIIPPKADGVPSNLFGWTVSYTGGYYRASRRLNGVVRSVHLCKEWDRVQAEIKIKEWELKNAAIMLGA